MTFDPAAAGWTPKPRDDFPNHNGPIWEILDGKERVFGFLADRRHVNDRGVVHGGMLMTFADHSLGELVLDSVERRECATIQLNTHFLRAVQLGDFVEIRGRIKRGTRSLVFIHGILSVKDDPVAEIDGIWKVLNKNGGTR